MGRFLNGLLFGLGIGFLIAPQKGQDARRYLNTRFNSLNERVGDLHLTERVSNLHLNERLNDLNNRVNDLHLNEHASSLNERLHLNERVGSLNERLHLNERIGTLRNSLAGTNQPSLADEHDINRVAAALKKPASTTKSDTPESEQPISLKRTSGMLSTPDNRINNEQTTLFQPETLNTNYSNTSATRSKPNVTATNEPDPSSINNVGKAGVSNIEPITFPGTHYSNDPAKTSSINPPYSTSISSTGPKLSSSTGNPANSPNLTSEKNQRPSPTTSTDTGTANASKPTASSEADTRKHGELASNDSSNRSSRPTKEQKKQIKRDIETDKRSGDQSNPYA